MKPMRWLWSAVLGLALPLGGFAQAVKLVSPNRDGGSRFEVTCETATGWRGNRCELRTFKGGSSTGTPGRLHWVEMGEEHRHLIPAVRLELRQPEPDGKALPADERAIVDATTVSMKNCWVDKELSDLAMLCASPTSGKVVMFVRGLCDRCRFEPVVLTGTPVYSPTPVPEPPSQPDARLAADTSPPVRTSALRFDGIYASRPTQSPTDDKFYRGYLRFFENGQLVMVSADMAMVDFCKVHASPVRTGTAGLGTFTKSDNAYTMRMSWGSSRQFDFGGAFDAGRFIMKWPGPRPGETMSRAYDFHVCPAGG